jgi:metallo-beta-lactamase class B
MDKDTVFTVGRYSFETYFPGHGRTADNIVVGFEKEKILYGGCLLKSTEDDDLGYLGDASVKEYATSIKNVQKKCKNPSHVIVGHGDWSSIKSLKHTLTMAERLKKKNDR